MRDRPEGDVFQIGGPLHRRRAEVERFARAVDRHAGHERAEVERRRDVVRDVEICAPVCVAVQVLIRRLEHGPLLLVGAGNAAESERVGEHGLGDALRARLLKLRPQDARQERAAETYAGEAGEKAAPALVVE